MKAFNLLFEAEDGLATSTFNDTQPRPTSAPDGWIGSAGPAISWPRGPVTGLPMFHALTLRLPADYQRRGPQFPGIAFFQGEGQFAEDVDKQDATDPFLADLAAYQPHPQLTILTDVIDGHFALVWLTEAELAAGPTAPPADVRRPGEHGPDDEGPNAWDEVQPTRAVWLVERADPNAGIVPTEEDGTDYTPVYDPDTSEWHPWAEPLNGLSHLGGSCFCIQAMPEGLTPYYLELEELPGLNFGSGNAQIDLESGVFDWACD